MDYSLYLVTDSSLARGRSHREIVAAAIRGGVTMVQYREKNGTTREMVTEALDLRNLCHGQGIPFIVNDRLDVALAVDADGVHVGQDDLPATLARKLIGRGKILGVSAGNVEQALAAVADGADYVGASPVFATPTKPDAPAAMGLQGLEAMARAIAVPLVAIGGVNASNAASMIRAGARGVAVVSAIVNADDVEAAARELRRVIDQARKELTGDATEDATEDAKDAETRASSFASHPR
jgi:thiamine-phosphate pyrophosphorylase